MLCQATYLKTEKYLGTRYFWYGKSHAGAVVKHLFCDNLEDIEDYIKVRIKDHNLRTRLKSLRENRRYFPVVLSGVEGAYNLTPLV